MTGTRFAGRLKWIGAAYAAVLLSRLALILVPPAGYLYNHDEYIMTASVLDRFLGLPSGSLAWPGTALQFGVVPMVAGLVGASCLSAGHSAIHLSCVQETIGHLYLHPWGLLTAMRVLSALIGCLTPLLIYRAAMSLSASRPAALLSAAFSAVVPLLWRHQAMATGDAASISLALAAWTLALRENQRPTRAALSGVLAGAAIACKVTASGLCLGALLLLLGARKEPFVARARLVLTWIAGASIAFLFFCPYVWTDPIRFLKSVVGNLARSGAGPHGFGLLSDALVEAATPAILLFALLALLGLVVLFRRREGRGSSVAIVLTLLLLAVPLMRAPVVFPRYTLPLLSLLCVLSGVGLSALFDLRPRSRWIVGACVLLTVVATAGVSLQAEYRARQPTPEQVGLARILDDTRHHLAFVPDTDVVPMLAAFSSEDFARVRARAEHILFRPEGIEEFLDKGGVDKSAADVLLNAFNEDEQLILGQVRAMQAAAPHSDHALFLYSLPHSLDTTKRVAWADGSFDDAVRAFRLSTDSPILLSPGPIPELHGEGLGNGWFLYRHSE